MDSLDELKESFLSLCGSTSKNSPLFIQDDQSRFVSEITSWRTLIRRHGYLSEPLSDRQHLSLGGESLDTDLVKFSELASMKRQQFYDKTIAVGNFGSTCKIEPVYVTKSEREKSESLSSQSKEVISRKIEELLSQLPNEELREYYSGVWKGSKGKCKDDLLQLHGELNLELLDTSVDGRGNDEHDSGISFIFNFLSYENEV